MDANSVYDSDTEAPSHPLAYHPGRLTLSPSHDGKLATLVATCNLCLPLATQHVTRPFPASHIMGKNQIDYILVSKAILPAVEWSGVLSHHSLLRGDHRPYYLDFNAAILFSYPAYQIEPATVRKLRLIDPRVVQSYRTALHDLLAQHNVFYRLDIHQESFDNNQWSPESQVEYESLDNIITESMLTAEKGINKQITTTYQWSPTLKKAVQQLRYWNMRLRQLQGQPVSEVQLRHLQIEGDISLNLVLSSSEVAVKQAQHWAFQNLKTLQSQHEELRESFLEGLAEAIVLNRCPKLANEGLESIKRDRAEKQLKN
jgi:hypothetical protein